ncbi:MAG: ribonuclease E/G [Lachnospiraceae bacterium]|nr:ribonuclease E/G [Lachnospiraceae bacterium]
MSIQEREKEKQLLSEMRQEAPRFVAFCVTDANGAVWKAAYLIAQGRIQQVWTEQAGSPKVGDIYLGRVVQNAKNIGASFVETQGGRFFLPGLYRVGMMLPVMVETLAYREKLAKVTAVLAFHTENMVLTEGKEGIAYSQKLTAKEKEGLQEFTETEGIRAGLTKMRSGLLLRTKAAQVPAEALRKEFDRLRCQWETVKRRAAGEQNCVCLAEADALVEKTVLLAAEYADGKWITESEGLYREALAAAERLGTDAGRLCLHRDDTIGLSALYGLQKKLRRILSDSVWLDSGAELVFAETEALCVIDVNSAKAQPGKEREEVFLKLNLEAAREIAYQIVARNLSGIILVDFISMRSKESETILISEMKKLLAGLYPRATVVDITKLGIMEISRQRLAGSIRERKEILDRTILL